jgi:signal transduction histidine kinase
VELRILIHAPIGKDARLISQAFEQAGIESFICAHATEIARELARDVGALFIVSEALVPELLRPLSRILKKQPSWSDLPIVVLSQSRLDSSEMRSIYANLGNVTLLERPVQSVTLASAATAALRARRRQYEMREIDRRKDEFLAMLAHELRNPLAPISAASDLLRLGNFDGARIRQTSEIISRQVKHMTGLIDDLLDVSRVSRGLVTLDKELLDAGQIVTNAVEQVRPLIDARRHRLTIQKSSEAAFVYGDRKRLIQIVANMLNNAAKYTPEGGDIVLTMEVTRDQVIFILTDNGIGMTPSLIENAFEMFAQAERTSDRAQGGLGIGLALVKRLVELHHGEVTVQSEGIGKGSRFTVTLPRTLKAEVMQPIQVDAKVPAAKGLRLLIVDDNLDASHMLGMFLELVGYNVAVENSSKAALERALAEAPHACLLDIGLPDMDGNQLAQQLRAHAKTANAVLIAITGYGQDSDRKKAVDSGFDHHFVKPVDMDRLLNILSELS